MRADEIPDEPVNKFLMRGMKKPEEDEQAADDKQRRCIPSFLVNCEKKLFR